MRNLLFVTLMFLSAHGHSAENMTFHGTLVEPPCTINNGQVVDVAFGDRLSITKIDGINYRLKIDYSVDCENNYMPYNLGLVVDSTHPTSFDSSAVTTDKPGLGIRILMDGEPIKFAELTPIDPSSLPVLEAVPVQESGVTLEEGAFEATMTLRIDYL